MIGFSNILDYTAKNEVEVTKYYQYDDNFEFITRTFHIQFFNPLSSAYL